MGREAHFGFVVAAALIAGACQKAPPPRPKPTAEETYAAKVQADIRERMKDPESTKFRNVDAYVDARCAIGEFMSKNGYGAYDGWQDFVWINDDLVTEEQNSLAYINVLEANTKCRLKMSEGLSKRRLLEAK